MVIPGSEVSFSSYPGILVSIDDFYVLKSRLVVMETTIGNSNSDLWKYVTSSTNLYWIRCLVANRLAVNGDDWARWFSLHNSGTYVWKQLIFLKEITKKIKNYKIQSYNNEWMIIDYKLFYPGEPLRKGLLTVLEQIPGQVYWEDKTDTLVTQTYWPSYNIA